MSLQKPSFSAYSPISQWLYIMNILYCPTLFFIKSTILFLYLRVFVPNRNTNMGMFIAIYAVIGALFTFYLVITAFAIFICHPREKVWNVFKPGSCYDIAALLKAVALFNVISDICILVLPIRSIWKLQVTPRKKIRIFVVLAVGVL